MVNSVWHRYINTNLRHQSVKLALQIHQMANSVWHRYINTNVRHQSGRGEAEEMSKREMEGREPLPLPIPLPKRVHCRLVTNRQWHEPKLITRRCITLPNSTFNQPDQCILDMPQIVFLKITVI